MSSFHEAVLWWTAKVGRQMAVDALIQAFAITQHFQLEVDTPVLMKDLLEPSKEGRETEARVDHWCDVVGAFFDLFDFGMPAVPKP